MSQKWLFPTILLGALLVQCVYMAWDGGQTVDEAFYNGTGYPIVRYNSYEALGEHPPLMMQLGALPLLLLQPRFPINDPIYIGNSQEINLSKMGSRFLYQMGNDAHLILFLERVPIILITVLGGFFLFLWSQQLFGYGGACLSLLLFSFCPNVVTHGSIYTTDMGIAIFFFMALYALKHFFENPSIKRIFLLGVCCGLAFLSKMSALILFPTLFTLFIFYSLCSKDGFEKMRESSGKFDLWMVLLSVTILIAASTQKTVYVGIAPLCLSTLYLIAVHRAKWKSKTIFGLLLTIYFFGWIQNFVFAYTIAQKRGWVFSLAVILWLTFSFLATFFIASPRISSKYRSLLKLFNLIWLIVILMIFLGYTDFLKTISHNNPFQHYVRTFHIALTHVLSHHQVCVPGSFVTCDWKYFISAMSIKTPVVTLGLFFLGALGLIKLKISHLNKTLILFPPALFLAIASYVNSINIGIRHVLPVYLFIFLIAGGVFALISDFQSKSLKKIAQVLLGILLFLSITRNLFYFPHYLAYFNEFVGGPEQGIRLTSDSNLNWGQDNLRLIKLVKSKGIPHVDIASVTSNGPEYDYYGISWSYWNDELATSHLVPGFYALDLAVYDQEQKKSESWFKNRKPLFIAGKTFYIFEVK